MIRGAESLHVEIDAGRFHAGGGGREAFDRIVMGRRQHESLAAQKLFQHGDAQGRAFLRVGAGAQFVEQRPRIGVGVFEHRTDAL